MIIVEVGQNGCGIVDWLLMNETCSNHGMTDSLLCMCLLNFTMNIAKVQELCNYILPVLAVSFGFVKFHLKSQKCKNISIVMVNEFCVNFMYCSRTIKLPVYHIVSHIVSRLCDQ